jgi:polysaccharide biosynthesis transport protein
MEKVTALVGRYWKPLIAFNAAVAAAATVGVCIAPRVWTATIRFNVPSSSSGLEANIGALGLLKNVDSGVGAQVNPLNSQVAILTSDALMQSLLIKDAQKTEFVTLEQYRQLFDIKAQSQSSILEITAQGKSQTLAFDRITTLHNTYKLRLEELRHNNREGKSDRNQPALAHAEQNLHKIEQSLAEYKARVGLISPANQLTQTAQLLGNLKLAQAQASNAAQASQIKADKLQTQLGMDGDTGMRSLALSENNSYQLARKNLDDVDRTLAQAENKYTDLFPKVADLATQRDRLSGQVQTQESQTANGGAIDLHLGNSSSSSRAAIVLQLVQAENDAKAQQSQAQSLTQQIEKLEAEFSTLPGKETKLVDLQRQYELADSIYKGLQAQLQQINLDDFNTYPNVQVLDPPFVSEKPTSKVIFIVLNAILASILGSLAIVLGLERRNPTLNPADLEPTTFPTLACVPYSRHMSNHWALDPNVEVVFEQLASLITIQDIPKGRLLIASSIFGEGKTTTVLGLASALVELGYRVLMLDGDYHKATLSHHLGYDQDSPTQPVPIAPNLDLMPTQPKLGKVIDRLSHGQFAKSLERLQRSGKYDYVLIDSSPIRLTSETALMATVVDRILFVVRPGVSKRNLVYDSLDRLSRHKAKVIGFAVNGTETKNGLYRSRLHTPMEIS